LRTIKWEESWSVRRLAYGRRYIPYLLHALVIWDLWIVVIVMLYKWRVGAPPWSREGASAIGVIGLIGTVIRLIMETSSRTMRWSDEGFHTAHIGKFDCPLSAITDLQFSEVNDEWSRAEFYATKKSGRRQKYVIGIPRSAVAKVKALFGLESDSSYYQVEENKPQLMRPTYQSRLIFDLYWKGLGWIMICLAAIRGVEIMFWKDVKTQLEGAASAVFVGLIGVASIHYQAVMGWCLRMLTGRRDQGDD